MQFSADTVCIFSIFELHIERVLKAENLASNMGRKKCTIPIYVMTSAINDEIIKENFKSNNFFGYDEKSIFFFQQGLEPCLSLDEKLIIASRDSLAMAPDGNGGVYDAMLKSGALENMQSRGVKHLHIYGIDNVLTKSADPLFIGACIDRNVQVGNKVVWRAGEFEKVGTTVSLNGRMKVIEYTEIPPDLAEATDSDKKFVFGAANICNHYLSMEFLQALIPSLQRFYHLAAKKIPYYDPNLKREVKPDKNNGIKLEMFIFDVFPRAERWLVAEVPREDEFAPVKNGPGSKSDSPETARALVSSQAKRWLEKAGASFRIGSDSSNMCEISAAVSYCGEGLEEYSGQVVPLPTYIKSAEPSMDVTCSCTVQ